MHACIGATTIAAAVAMNVLGTDLGSALFRAKLAIAKQAERAWHAYIERKIREMLKGSPR
jgi:hypothetical protein